MADPAFLKTLYTRWQHAGDVDTGAMRFLGQYLADDCPPDEWRRKLEELNAKTAQTLIAGEGVELPEATRRATAIGWKALLHAQGILDERNGAARKRDLLPAVRVSHALGERARKRAATEGKSITNWLRQVVEAATQ